MSEIWMFTAPYKAGILKDLPKLWRLFDGKKYCIGLETGRGGYKHIQGRIEVSGDTSVEHLTLDDWGNPQRRRSSHIFDRMSPLGIHVQKGERWTSYEGKEGYYISSDDTPEIRQQRFGKPTLEQEWVLQLLESTNDREVMVWYDPKGNVGKSWLTGHLWEQGKAHYVRMVGSAESMIKDICSKMSGQRRPIVVIDIPRATKWNSQIYEAIEVIKDGLIDDPRYSANAINIRGVKVLVMCNTMPKLDRLSYDRWILYTRPDGATNST